MKTKRIRGHRRRWNLIENWKDSNLNLDLDYLTEHERDYVKLRIHPWNAISLTNSVYPEPKGRTKRRMMNGLFDIYDEWKNQLDKMGKPYYLKIWLYDKRFTMSQVVCATGESIEFYENAFNKSKNIEQINPNAFSKQIKQRIGSYNWECNLDEDHFDNTDLGEPEDFDSIEDYNENKIWFEKLMKKTHQTEYLKNQSGAVVEIYSFIKGKVWVGDKK